MTNDPTEADDVKTATQSMKHETPIDVYPISVYADQWLVAQHVNVRGLGRAGSSGDETQPHTDARGPSASMLIVDFARPIGVFAPHHEALPKRAFLN